MSNYAKILSQAYDQFFLSLGNNKIPAPYRINVPFQSDRSKYGKSDPLTLTADTIKVAKEQGFEMAKADTEQICRFMKKNLLGIDCSGFVYFLLDYLLSQTHLGGMQQIGFPPASQTNVKILTSDQFTFPVEDFTAARPGDLIRLNSDRPIPHVVIILKKMDNTIIYAHSSGITETTGVHSGEIKNGHLSKELKVYSFNLLQGDGIRRVKALA